MHGSDGASTRGHIQYDDDHCTVLDVTQRYDFGWIQPAGAVKVAAISFAVLYLNRSAPQRDLCKLV